MHKVTMAIPSSSSSSSYRSSQWFLLFLLLSFLLSATTAFHTPTKQTRHLPSNRSSITALHSSTAESSLISNDNAAPLIEINRRRNLAIISHPDSGKTTMTEKLLLYGGALQTAGAVRMKGEQRGTKSDFMEMEKERGISIR